jgi:hypothetical protein
MTEKFWKIVGKYKDGSIARMTVKAADYDEVLDRAVTARIKVRDIVLVEDNPMTVAKYLKAIAMVGLSQVKASEFFEVSRKTSPRWARGEAPIPGAVAKLLRVMIKHKISPEEVDKRE